MVESSNPANRLLWVGASPVLALHVANELTSHGFLIEWVADAQSASLVSSATNPEIIVVAPPTAQATAPLAAALRSDSRLASIPFLILLPSQEIPRDLRWESFAPVDLITPADGPLAAIRAESLIRLVRAFEKRTNPSLVSFPVVLDQHSRGGDLANAVLPRLANGIGNLLMAISGSVDGIDRAAPEHPGIAEHLADIRANTKQAARWLRDITLLSQAVPSIEPTDVALFLEALLMRLMRSLPDSVGLKARFERDVWAAAMDLEMIETVIAQLVNNAVEAMGPAGTILVECHNVRISEANPRSGLRTGDYVCIAVADTGLGIPQAVRDQIFDPFFTTKWKGGWHGLGLTLARSLVRRHQGDLLCSSVHGAGSVFELVVPRAETRPGDRQPLPAIPPQALPPSTFLVIDDEPGLVRTIERYLQANGHRVVSAMSGTEAIRLASEHGNKIDCAVLDVHLPDMSGFEVLRQIRLVAPQALIVLTSGFANPDEVNYHLRAYGAMFLPKPFAASDLVRMVARGSSPTGQWRET